MAQFALIKKYCEVIAETPNAIYYIEDGRGYADIYTKNDGWAYYSCESIEEFNWLCEIA